MNLEAAIAELEAGQSNDEMLAALRSRTVTRDGLAQSGYVLAYLASIGKIKAIRDIMANDAHPLRDAADATMITLETRDGFDFSGAGQRQMLAAFVQAGVLTQEQADIVQGIGTVTELEFDGLTLRQLIAVREPALLNASESNTIDLINKKGRAQLLVVTVGDGLPESVNLQFRVRNKFSGQWSQWEGSSIAGLTNKQFAGVYSARLPGEIIKSEDAQIKIVCPYAVNVSLSVE